MAAIITEQFRINSRKRLFDDITNSSTHYYVGIGKQEEWAELNPGSTQTSPFPAGTQGDAAEVRNNISAMFKIAGSNVATMIPNHIVQPDRAYKVYNPYDPTCFYASSSEFPCFAISRLDSIGGGTGDHVFLCIARSHTSTVASYSFNRIGSTTANIPGIYSYSQDGYVWLYIGRYTAANTSVNNGAFVEFNFDQDVLNGAASVSTGLIHGFHIVNSGYELTDGASVSVSVEIKGLKSNVKTTLVADALLTILNGKVVKITLNEDFNDGQTYRGWSNVSAKITTSGYNRVSIVPIVSPLDGYENHLETILPSWYIGVGADTLNAQFVPSGTSYRQISIIKNPKRNNASSITETVVDRVHPSFSTSGNGYAADERLTLEGFDVDSGWKIKQGNYDIATISSVEFKDDAWHYYYYNSIQGGLLNIDDTSDLTIVAPDSISLSTNQLTLSPAQYELNSSLTPTLFDKTSGEILFIDNRGEVTREQGQNEEIKIIIQL